MITLKEAYKIFKKKMPNLTVTAAALYKGKYYLFNAQENPNEVDYNDPFYVVDKNTGEVGHLLPSLDMDGFLDAIHNHEFDLKALR